MHEVILASNTQVCNTLACNSANIFAIHFKTCQDKCEFQYIVMTISVITLQDNLHSLHLTICVNKFAIRVSVNRPLTNLHKRQRFSIDVCKMFDETCILTTVSLSFIYKVGVIYAYR